MATSAPSKWAIGSPMIEWCERNGLDATCIPDRNDAITIEHYGDELIADVAHIYVDKAAADYPDVVFKYMDGDGRIEVTRRVNVDTKPPLNPEWVALFGEDAAWR